MEEETVKEQQPEVGPPSLRSRLRRNDRDIIFAAVAASVLVPLWLIFHSDRINKDGVWHLAMADYIVQGDWAAAMDLLAWPAYPALLAGIHLATGLSLEYSGYLWNFIAYGIVTFAFLSILRELGGDRKVLLFGVAILFLQPALNNTLPGLFRDQGYWAFYLVSILFFIRFWRSPNWIDAIAWWLAMATAMLFRVEGVVFLLLLPLALLARPQTNWRTRFALAAKAHGLTIATLFAGVATLLAAGINPLKWGRLAELGTRAERFWLLITEGLAQRAESLSDMLLTPYSEHQAHGALWAVMAVVLLGSTLRAVNWLYLALAIIAAAKRRMPRRDCLPLLLALVALNALVLTVFVINEMYLSFRYAAGMGFIVMVFAAFGITALYERYIAHWGQPLRRNWGFVLAAVLLGIVGGDGLYTTGARKTHEVEAGRWVKENVPGDARVLFSAGRIEHYAGRPFERRYDMQWDQLRPLFPAIAWQEYDYLVITVHCNDGTRRAEMARSFNCDPVQIFSNGRDDYALVFRVDDCRDAE